MSSNTNKSFKRVCDSSSYDACSQAKKQRFYHVVHQQEIIDREMLRRQARVVPTNSSEDTNLLQRWLLYYRLQGVPIKASRDFIFYDDVNEVYCVMNPCYQVLETSRRICDKYAENSDSSSSEDESDDENEECEDESEDESDEESESDDEGDTIIVFLDKRAEKYLEPHLKAQQVMVDVIKERATKIFNEHTKSIHENAYTDLDTDSIAEYQKQYTLDDLINKYNVFPPTLLEVNNKNWSFHFHICLMMCLRTDWALMYTEMFHFLFSNLEECLNDQYVSISKTCSYSNIVQLLYLAAQTTYNVTALNQLKEYVAFDCKF